MCVCVSACKCVGVVLRRFHDEIKKSHTHTIESNRICKKKKREEKRRERNLVIKKQRTKDKKTISGCVWCMCVFYKKNIFILYKVYRIRSINCLLLILMDIIVTVFIKVYYD